MNIDRVKSVYDEISKYEIKLAEDPRSLGPLYLQNMIATCRNYLNLVSRLQLEVHREKQDLDRALRAAGTTYEVSFSEILVNDERVRRLPSIEDRRAQANMILREQLSTIAELKGRLQDLEYVEKAVRHRHKELTSTMTEIKLQRSLIRDEIDSGAMYGDERRGDHERGHGPLAGGDDIDESELDALLEKETAPKPEAVVDEPIPAPEILPLPLPQAEKDEAAVRAFLDEKPERQAEKPSESEAWAEILENV